MKNLFIRLFVAVRYTLRSPRFHAGWLALLAAISFVFAMIYPLFVLTKGMTGIEDVDLVIGHFLGVDFDPEDFSLFTVVATFWSIKAYGLAMLVAAFGFFCPVAKLLGLCILTLTRRNGRWLNWVEWCLRLFARLSFIDIFVIAVLLLCVKQLPGDSGVSLLVGFYWFCLSAFASLFAGILLEFTAHRQASPEQNDRELLKGLLTEVEAVAARLRKVYANIDSSTPTSVVTPLSPANGEPKGRLLDGYKDAYYRPSLEATVKKGWVRVEAGKYYLTHEGRDFCWAYVKQLHDTWRPVGA